MEELSRLYNSIADSAGRCWQEKIEDVRKIMKEKDASALVVTALDEVACEHFASLFSI